MALAYALIHEEDGVSGISLPDYPGVVTTGRNAKEALRKAAAALSFHVAGMVEDGDPLPFLRSLAELQADPEFHAAAEGAVVTMVAFELPARSVRVNISMDEALLQAVDRAARAEGLSRSSFLADAALRKIRA